MHLAMLKQIQIFTMLHYIEKQSSEWTQQFVALHFYRFKKIEHFLNLVATTLFLCFSVTPPLRK